MVSAAAALFKSPSLSEPRTTISGTAYSPMIFKFSSVNWVPAVRIGSIFLASCGSKISSVNSRPSNISLSISIAPALVWARCARSLTKFMPTISQSSSRTITSCATSTSRRVKYPESAVLSAVSASPLRAPCVDIKYSSTVRPSRKLALIGKSIIRPDGSAISPRIPANWRICWILPLAPELAII